MKGFKLVRIETIFLCLLFSCSTAFSQSKPLPRVYEIWDDQPAPNRGADFSIIKSRGYPFDADWEAHSYPIGNGYMGANVFGRTDVERIQITDKTLTNGAPYGSGGMTNFAEIFLEFDHYEIENYKRSLNLNDGIFYTNYEHKGVKYSREYLANYPYNVIAIKLNASENAKISCTVRATVPYLRSVNDFTNSGSTISELAKFATTSAQENTIVFSGNVPSFSLNYEGQIKIINEGGKLVPNNENGSNEIRIIDANSAVILVAVGTNYKLSDQIFLNDSTRLKLNPDLFPHNEVLKTINHATALGFEKLKESHLEDYQNLFSRVNLELSETVPKLPTKTLVENYKQNAAEVYLEELMFHFGRYLLIASSRPGTLPCGLQGVWSQYQVTPWSGGYWHNINIQMNYWGAFSANLAETFVAYEEYFNAYLHKAYQNGSEYVQKWHPDALSKNPQGNGWCIGTGANAYAIGSPGGHSGPGTGGFTTKVLWDRFEFTQDTTFLSEIAYPALLGMSTFLSKTLVPSEDGKLLVDRSASPEQRHNGEHYMTKGTTFDQGFVWETYNDLIKSEKILKKDEAFLETVSGQINKLDPILIGESGQVKEYREEKKYSDIGDPKHRHISHLCPIYPGTLINSENPEWVDAVSTTLDLRGNNTTGWAMAHRMNVRARTKEAEKAHEVYSKFLRERTLPNLWTIHPPFQIDGNLGTMAGVVEMLLQSHEGVIELLPALPEAWKEGSFNGLVARGNFEISAKWESGKITGAEIISNVGGVCNFKYPDHGDILIKNNSGKLIPLSRGTDNIIKFNTLKNEKYIVYQKEVKADSMLLEGKWVKVSKKKFEPTLRDIAYGPHERNKLDFWKAESTTPTPLVFYIHGGGWGGGSKEENKGPYLNLLKNGVSYVSINYRLARGENKLPCSLTDAARALQFVRSKAKEWNIDPERIIATGGSAGGCSSLWLALHDDLANPKSKDPIERESTRLLAAAVISAQTTINAMLIQQRIGTSATNHSMIWNSAGASSPNDLFDNWAKYKELALECSPLEHLSKDDPPIYLTYNTDSPKPITSNGIHHAEFGRILKEASDSLDVKCIFDLQTTEKRQEELEKFMLKIFTNNLN